MDGAQAAYRDQAVWANAKLKRVGVRAGSSEAVGVSP